MRIIGLILNKQRPTSHISRLHSRHLLGKGYNEIIAKISENQEKMKKNLRIKSSKQSSGSIINYIYFLIEKLSRFQIDKSDLNLYAAKKKLADEISQMIISNLKNSRDASGYLHDDNGREGII